MRTNMLFHPHHAVPAVEFIAAVIELSDKAVTHMTVKFNAAACKVFILAVGVGYAGVKV